VKLARFIKEKDTYFVSWVEVRSNTIISTIKYTYKYIQNIFHRVGQLEETKVGGKEKRM
jgi:hypothetical protein